MTIKNGIRILLTDEEMNKNKEVIEYLKEIKTSIPDDYYYRKELIRNTIDTLEMITKGEFIDF